MNGAPPPLPSRPPIQPAREGMGCFAKGCLTLLIVGFLLVACGLGGTWYLYVKMVDNLTSPEAADVQVQPPSESQYQTAETSMNRLREAVADNKETTVEFTAADLNALFARDPAFSDWRGRIRIEIADSTMTIAITFDSAAQNKKALLQRNRAFQFQIRSRGLQLRYQIRRGRRPSGSRHFPERQLYFVLQ
jgi:hypothetical protein